MTLEEHLIVRLEAAIASHEAYLKRFIDTGTMGRLSAYRDVLEEIRSFTKEHPCNSESASSPSTPE